MEFRILGPVEVAVDGDPIDIGPRQQRKLLALLLLSPNQVVSTDLILEELWGEEAGDRKSALWTQVSRLRNTLEPDRPPRGDGTVLLTTDHGYRLIVKEDSLDAGRFEQATQEGRDLLETDPARAANVLRRALTMWRGTPLQDFAYEEFAQAEITRLNELRLAALEDRIEADLKAGRATGVIGELEALAVHNPVRERVTMLLMRALFRAGRQAEALRAYSRLRIYLIEELGIEPSEAVRDLEQRILDQDPALSESPLTAIARAPASEEPELSTPSELPASRAIRAAEPTITDFVTDRMPFGPIAMDAIATRRIYRDLYSTHTELHDEIIRRRPSFIVGRRGSGKTALMRVPLLDPSNLLVEFTSSELFAQVLACVDELERRGGRLFVQQIGDIWDGVVWSGLFLAATNSKRIKLYQSPELEMIRRYVAGVGDEATLTVDDLGAAFCRQLVDAAGADPRPLVRQVQLGGVDFGAAKDACRSLLQAASMNPIVLIDSMEDLHVEMTTLSRVLAGLFGLIGRSDRSPAEECDFRLCYPSELWSKLSDFAANPLKDAENHIKLYWSARQLMTIAGHRLHLFLRLYHPQHLSDALKGTFDPTSFYDARFVLQSILPAEVTGTGGRKEDTLAYIMRHTQLLPRHLLRILNGIMQRTIELGEPATSVSEEAVIDGVRRVEELLVTEIFTAYGSVHPLARDACRRLIPELPIAFSEGYLHQRFNRTGIRKNTGLAYPELKEMLVEIGCLGRVIDRTDRYVEGEFDYTLPTPLFPSAEDDLCLHPLFANVFHARRAPGPDDTRVLAVYPYGSDPDHAATW
ncbi:MAG: AfsR/SARP family transcriptional regulator [Acidimicrobiia bacterium]